LDAAVYFICRVKPGTVGFMGIRAHSRGLYPE
jgi:hypothetical protein